MSNFQKVIKVLAICFAIFLIVNIFGIILFGITLLTGIGGIVYPTIDTEISEEIISETYDDIDKIDIDLTAAELTIKVGEEFKVETQNMKDNFSSKVVNGTLKLEENKKWFWNDNISGEIVLYVPQNENLRELNIETGAGKITIDGISSEKAEIDHGAGVLEISNSSFQNANIDGGAGKIAINSSVLNNLNLDTGVGRVDIEAEITGRSEINSGIGEVNINILGNEEEYEIIAEKGLGNLKVKNQEQTANLYHYGSGNNVIDVEGGIGNININFINENNV